MRLRYTPEEVRFRDSVRGWLADTIPTLGTQPDIEDWSARRAFDTTWQRLQYDAGFAGIDWPAEYGGCAAPPTHQLIFLEECERARAPYGTANYVGLNHAGPTIIAEGTDSQKTQFLRPILQGDEVWCQGFSEPEAGSDLAALQTRAVRDGDDYIVQGRKVWTSHAPIADYCELLVRTDPAAPRHRGISWLILPMNAPGVTVRPLRTLLGSADFAEVLLDDVRVPVANRVGPENDGWRVAMVTLAFERGTAFANEVLASFVLIDDLVAMCQRQDVRSRHRPWEDDEIRSTLSRLAAELDGLWALLRRNVSRAARGQPPTVGASLFKLRFTEFRQELFAAATRLLGRAAIAIDDIGDIGNGSHVLERLRGLSLTIAGGTSQVQRNIIAERVLGLPKQ